MQTSLWQQCLRQLENELSPQQYNTWIRPLQAVEGGEGVEILAPNRFVLDWIRDKYCSRIQSILDALSPSQAISVSLGVGSLQQTKPPRPETRQARVLKSAEPSLARFSRPGWNVLFMLPVSGYLQRLTNQVSTSLRKRRAMVG